MYLRRAITALLLVVFCTQIVFGRVAILPRQDENTDATTVDSAEPTDDAAPTTGDGPLSAEETGAAPLDDNDDDEEPSTTDGDTADETATPTPTSSDEDENQDEEPSTTTTPPTPTEPADSAVASPTESHKAAEELPIQPTITPGIGIAGVILLASGVALALVGIKHQSMQVCLSTALLSALAVSVLILYVMSPPVSDGIQGAYVVAAVMTGLILGGVAWVFQDITEGLGCLLGGFCLSMWFLCLSPGGLISSKDGRAAMIGVFSAVGLCTSFSHHTRNYALILCTSFAGAQTTILGVDCFSRAGLKEFWLYIWALNENIFPLDTNTYPVTRGIRVEIACTMVLFLFGVMSQFKIWKIVKERRAKREAAKEQLDLENRQNEEEMGRELEWQNERDKAQWEAAYGNKDGARVHVDSSVGTSEDSIQKNSGSVRERELDTIEMDDLPRQSISHRTSKQSSRNRHASRAQTGDDNEDAHPESQVNLLDNAQTARSTTTRSHYSRPTQSRASSPNSAYDVSRRTSMEMPQMPGGPEVVPLPFSPPVEEDEDEANSERGSMHSGGTGMKSVQANAGQPLNMSSLRKLDKQGGLAVPRTREERPSSVAATAEYEPEVVALFPAPPSRAELPGSSEESSSDESEDEQKPAKRAPSIGRSVEPPLEVEAEQDEDDEMLIRRTPVKEPEPEPEREPEQEQETQTSTKRKSSSKKKRHSTASRRSASRKSASRKSASLAPEADGSERGVSVSGSLTEHLPEGMSKIAMAYRTNEWAKHAAEAAQPDDNSDSGSISPGVQIDHSVPEEPVRPVDTRALMETAPAGDGRDLKRKSAKRSSTNPYRRSAEAPKQARQSSALTATPVYAHAHQSTSMPAMNRQSSSKPSQQQLAYQQLTQQQPAQQHPQPQAEQQQAREQEPLEEASAVQQQPFQQQQIPQQSLQPDSTPQRPRARISSAPLLQEPLIESPIEDEPEPSSAPFRNSSAPMHMPSMSNLMDERNDRLKRQPTTTSFTTAQASTPNLTSPSQTWPLQSSTPATETPTHPDPTSDGEDMTLAQRRDHMQRQQSTHSLQPTPTRTPPSSTSSPHLTHRASFQPALHKPQRQSSLDPVQHRSILTPTPHAPHRQSSFDPSQQASTAQTWRRTLQADTRANGGGSGLVAQAASMTPDARNSMLAQREQAAAQREQRRHEQQRRESLRDSAMRSGAMRDAHGEALRRMQREAREKTGVDRA